MFSEISKIKVGTNKQQGMIQKSVSMAQARAQLEADFDDADAVARALKMLGQRTHISPQVSSPNQKLIFRQSSNRSFSFAILGLQKIDGSDPENYRHCQHKLREGQQIGKPQSIEAQ